MKLIAQHVGMRKKGKVEKEQIGMEVEEALMAVAPGKCCVEASLSW